ncbi:NADH dehydrogenase [ubiquinone] flavoprotein 3, mitochondrial isoform X2 [Onychomys torridus]|uniref:NADH dehydrogenase [ubiquinone] flavoprotein 3, mitochondrial isoform X2 n=1 Tax=Onychomys torridus TaxID=38674 RepID=UPI00167FDB99|nr:NADH dehydrogenase [ubiquinone] flavoprotein 3, mitochondrial isoform X2 [Onychomys torridus]
MALLLRGGRIRALKAVFLEARVFRELPSTVPLSTESGKSGGGIQPNPKNQSAPTDVVGAEERGKLLATHTAAPLSKSASPRSSYPAVENTGGAVAGPHPGGSLPLTDEGLPKRLSRKTLVEFPQKVTSPPQVQGSDSEARRHVQKGTNDSSSSSSSSSNSSDSDSDGEGHVSNIGPQVASKGKAGFYKPEASRPFQNGVPKITVPAKEKAKVQKPRTDVTYPEKSQQPKKKGTITKPVGDSKEAKSKPMASRSQSSELLEQTVKEEHPQEKPRPSKTRKESPKPFEAERIVPDRTKARSSAQLAGGSVPTTRTQGASAEEQLPAAAPRAGARHLEPQGPEPEWKAASPRVLVGKESPEKQVPEGCPTAKVETLEDQIPVSYSKTVPVQKKDTLEEKAGPQLEGSFQEAVGEAPPTDAGPPQEAPDDTQEPTLVPESSNTTTYKNLQHHEYNSYTFLDLNLDLSKFRMPQPSSGRESPRH